MGYGYGYGPPPKLDSSAQKLGAKAASGPAGYPRASLQVLERSMSAIRTDRGLPKRKARRHSASVTSECLASV